METHTHASIALKCISPESATSCNLFPGLGQTGIMHQQRVLYRQGKNNTANKTKKKIDTKHTTQRGAENIQLDELLLCLRCFLSNNIVYYFKSSRKTHNVLGK